MAKPSEIVERDDILSQRELTEAVKAFLELPHDQCTYVGGTYTNGDRKPEDSDEDERKIKIFANIARALERNTT